MSSYATSGSSSSMPLENDPYQYEDGSYQLDSTSATLTDSGTSGLTDLGNEYQDNEAVSGLVVGSQADIYNTQANMGASLAYNNAMMDSMYQYQVGLETQKTGNTATLMGVEGGITEDLMYTQGEIDEDLINAQGAVDENLIYAQGGVDTGLINTQGAVDENLIYAQGDVDENLIYAQGDANESLARVEGRQDRLGYRVQGQQQRKAIRVQGDEDRESNTNDYNNQMRMQADARGAISNQNATFYG